MMLEHEFEDWDNVLQFMNTSTSRLLRDIQSIQTKVPIDESLLPFMALLKQKMLLNELILSRNTSL